MATRIVVCVTLMAGLRLPCARRIERPKRRRGKTGGDAQPGTFNEIRMKDGSHFKGTFVQRFDDRVVVKPRTRVAVPAREVALDGC